MITALIGMVNAGLRVSFDRCGDRAQQLKSEIVGLERKTTNLVRFIADGVQTPTLRDELLTMEGALLALRSQLAKLDAGAPGAPREVDKEWVQRQILRLRDLLDSDPVRAKSEIARHLEGPLVFKPQPAARGERRAEIFGSWKRNGLLGQPEPTGRPFAHFAGCGGPQSTDYATSLPFQFEVSL